MAFVHTVPVRRQAPALCWPWWRATGHWGTERMGMHRDGGDRPQGPDDELQLRVEDLRPRAQGEILDDRPVMSSIVSARRRRPSSDQAGRVVVVLGLVALAVAVVLAGDPALRG